MVFNNWLGEYDKNTVLPWLMVVESSGIYLVLNNNLLAGMGVCPTNLSNMQM
jgi:hypothetical protein